MTALATLPTLAAAIALLAARARARSGRGLTGFEVMDDFSLELVRRHFAAAAPAARRQRRGRCCSSTPMPKSEAHATRGARGAARRGAASAA